MTSSGSASVGSPGAGPAAGARAAPPGDAAGGVAARARDLAAAGRRGPALRLLKESLRELRGGSVTHDLVAALRTQAAHMPAEYRARYWAELVADAEAPHKLSARDGKLIKPVRGGLRLSKEVLEGRVLAGFVLGHEAESRALLCRAWEAGREPRRHLLLAVRAYAYLNLGQEGHAEAVEQAAKDALAALAFGPKRFARGHALKGQVHAAGQDWVQAVLAMGRAVLGNPGSAEFLHFLQRYVAELPEKYREVFRAEGLEGLERWLQEEAELALPPYLQRRPKYYHFYEWMTGRIHEHFPALCEPILDKLLTMDSGELDLLLSHPKAIRGQVEEFQAVLDERGAAYLETYQSPRLTWEEARALKGPAAVGLGLGDGGEAGPPGAGLEAPAKDTDHALAAAGGSGGLTEAERLGAPVRPALPPDQMRDRLALEAGYRAEKQRLLAHAAEEGRLPSAGMSGRRQAIMQAAEEAILASEAPKLLANADLDGID